MPAGNFERTSSASMKANFTEKTVETTSVSVVTTKSSLRHIDCIESMLCRLPIIYTTYTRRGSLSPQAFRYAREHIRKIAVGLAEHVAPVVARADNARTCSNLILPDMKMRSSCVPNVTVPSTTRLTLGYSSFHLTYNNSLIRGTRLRKAVQKSRDYIFIPNYKKVALTTHMVDENFEWIIATNYRSSEWVISKGTRQGSVAEYEDTNVYLLDPTTGPIAGGETEKCTDWPMTLQTRNGFLTTESRFLTMDLV